MAIILSEISEQFSDINVHLVAGEEGLNTPVSWVHVVERIEIAPFLEGGELAFMTGLALQNEEEFLALVQAIHCHGASGLIVNVGPFIKAVPQTVLAFAQTVGFPLMTAPWEVRLSDIMRVLTLEITTLSLRDMELEVALKRAIVSPENPKDYLPQLQNQSVDTQATFACAVAQITQGESPVSQERLTAVKSALQTHLHHGFPGVTPLLIYNKLVLAVPNPSLELMKTVLAFCNEKVPLRGDETLSCCVGNTVQGVENLGESFEKASKLLVKKFQGQTIFYDDMGVYALLSGVENQQTLTQFYTTTVEPLVDYDRTHQSDLLEILQLYLTHNASVQTVAELKFLHRNTVNYKLGKISEILGVNLSDLQCRVHLTLGLAIFDLLS